jgi:gliding motility-associated lipoprotein GldD
MKLNKLKNIYHWRLLVLFGCILLMVSSCKKVSTPKPRGYFRIDLPQKQYQLFRSDCNFQFEAPVYSLVKPNTEKYAEKCWYNMEFKGYNANVYLTYKPIKKNLPVFIEDIRTIVYKHSIKADDIIETIINQPDQKVYGMLYDIKGNAASSVNFYITDSVSGFLSGSLYFNSRPNKDSLAPAIDFFREDILHIINSFKWN